MKIASRDNNIIMVLCPSRLMQGEGQRSVDYFDLVAKTFEVPILFSENTGLNSADIGTLLSEVLALAKDMKQPHLLLAGGYLEDDLTLVCLDALAHGLEVFILADNVFARDGKFQKIQLQRLFQAGAVPATLNQFLYQWINEIEDKLTQESVRAKLSIV